MSGYRIKLRNCPKCNKPVIRYIEIWIGHSVEFCLNESINGEFPHGNLEPGDPDHVEGHCDNCGHIWRLRGVSQISDLQVEK